MSSSRDNPSCHGMTELACAACRVVVNPITDTRTGAVVYAHPFTGEEHEIVAAEMDEADVIWLCDFCLAPGPAWEIPLLEHASTVGNFLIDQETLSVSVEDTDALWGACEECADCVRRHDRAGLRNRAFIPLARHYAPHPPPEWHKQTVLVQLYAFWASVPGPMVKMKGC